MLSVIIEPPLDRDDIDESTSSNGTKSSFTITHHVSIGAKNSRIRVAVISASFGIATVTDKITERISSDPLIREPIYQESFPRIDRLRSLIFRIPMRCDTHGNRANAGPERLSRHALNRMTLEREIGHKSADHNDAVDSARLTKPIKSIRLNRLPKYFLDETKTRNMSVERIDIAAIAIDTSSMNLESAKSRTNICSRRRVSHNEFHITWALIRVASLVMKANDSESLNRRMIWGPILVSAFTDVSTENRGIVVDETCWKRRGSESSDARIEP